MKENWEYSVLGLIGVVGGLALVTYLVAFEYFERQATKRWFQRQLRELQLKRRQVPIYGPADPYRVKGPNARPNLRLVSR